MARVAFFNIPFHGHINPTLPLVRELVDRGEDVTYFLTETFRAPVEQTGARFQPYESVLAQKDGSVPFLPARLPAEGRAVIPRVVETLRASRPDYVIYEGGCAWGWIAAQLLGVPAICFRSTMILDPRAPQNRAFIESRQALFAPVLERAEKDLAALTHELGLPPMNVWEMMIHTQPLNIVCVPRSFQPGGESLDERYVFVGPSIRARGDTGDFPLSRLEGGPVLYISLGTLFNDWPDFYRMCFAAFGGTPWRVVLSTGHAVNLAELGRVPDNFVMRPSVPQLEVLERASVFVTHGGANSLMESFANGVPVVVLPQMAEQPLNAMRVAQLGLGLALQKESVTVERLREAVERVENEPGFREKARAMQQEMREAGGYRRAADAILAFRARQVSSATPG
jgi:MGT family glycosyltransferase